MISNAKIIGVSLGFEDHNLLTFSIMTEGELGCQGFGGYVLYNESFPNRDVGGKTIQKILQVVEVGDWNKLIGKVIRVERDEPYGLIQAIGHIYKDIWFIPKEFYNAD